MNRKFLVAGVYVLCLTVASFAATMQVESLTVSSRPGSISIPVTLNADTAFTGFQFTFRYNPNILRLTGIDKGPLVASFSVMNNTEQAGVIRMAGFDPGLTGVSGTGVLANIHFEVLNDGYSYLALGEVKLSDNKGKPLPCAIHSGFFRVASSSPAEGSTTPGVTVQTGDANVSVSVSSSGDHKTTYTRIQTGGATISVPGTSASPAASTASVAVPGQDTWQQPVPSTTSAQPEGKKAPAVETPSNSVVLLVKSDYGKTVPSPGVTTYTRGDTVECRVETAILVQGEEVVSCTGYEGSGSAPSGSGNAVSFVIQEDSKLTWKWEKKPLEKGFALSAPDKIIFSLEDKEIRLEVKAVFLGGFTDPVKITIKTPAGLQVLPEEKAFTVEKNGGIFQLRKTGKLPAGSYKLLVEGVSGEKKKTADVSLVVTGQVKLDTLSLDRKKGIAETSLLLSDNISKVSTLQLILEVPPSLKLKEARPCLKEQKLFKEVQTDKNTVKITGFFFPASFSQNLLTFVFDCNRLFTREVAVRLKDVTLWTEGGEKIPVVFSP